ncbi:MAG: alcohol dehydrogenase catalytic domain-containing protein [Chloroflexi bacterium]|nr:alcohol dehydrogenase catalytic domain-containing protein [Chloroflexota bacterium]
MPGGHAAVNWSILGSVPKGAIMPISSFAAVNLGPGAFEVREFPVPDDIPGDAALLQVEACGICGSDLSGLHGRAGGEERVFSRGPHIMGHENLGIIYRIGRKAAERWKVKEGDRVCLEEYVPCGACAYCRSDDYRFCGTRGGEIRYGGAPVSLWPALWGGYSQYLYVHPNAIVHKMPSHILATHAAAFLPFSNGVEWAYEYGDVRLGESIWVQGPGQQGLAAVIAAKAAGAGCIIVSGLTQDKRRLDVAQLLGADHTLDADAHPDPVQQILDWTGGEGVNVVVNVTGGGKGCVDQAVAVAHKRKCNIVLAAAGRETLDLSTLPRKKIALITANGHSYRSVELAIQFIASGRLPMDQIATHTFPLSRALEALETLAGIRPSDAIHVSIMPTVN